MSRLDERIAEHNAKEVLSVKAYTPLRLVYAQNFISESEARQHERMLKDKRLEKERLIKHIEEDCGFV